MIVGIPSHSASSICACPLSNILHHFAIGKRNIATTIAISPFTSCYCRQISEELHLFTHKKKKINLGRYLQLLRHDYNWLSEKPKFTLESNDHTISVSSVAAEFIKTALHPKCLRRSTKSFSTRAYIIHIIIPVYLHESDHG